jgi:hypothetical protein
MELIIEAKRLQKLAGIIIEQNTPAPEDAPIPAQPTNIPKPSDSPTTIDKNEAKRLIKSSKGKFITITFIKKDGTTRIMNCRLGVKAYLKGGTLPFNPESKNMIPVYDITKRDYRLVNFDTITHLKIGANKYDVQ